MFASAFGSSAVFRVISVSTELSLAKLTVNVIFPSSSFTFGLSMLRICLGASSSSIVTTPYSVLGLAPTLVVPLNLNVSSGSVLLSSMIFT